MSKINIITANYKTPNELFEKCINSVKSQQTQYSYRHIIEYDSIGIGPGATRNLALAKLDEDCEYICLLDADDYLEDNSLECRADFLTKNQEYIAVYGNKFNEKDGQKTLEVTKHYSQQLLYNECYIPSGSCMWRADVFKKYIKRYLENIWLAEDYNIWLKLSYLGNFYKIENTIYTQVLHGTNITLSPDKLKNHFRDLQVCFRDFYEWRKTI